MTAFHAIVAAAVGLLFIAGVVFVIWAHFRRSSLIAAVSTAAKLEPYAAPVVADVVHPAVLFEQWIRDEALKKAALAKADILATYHIIQDIENHRAAFAPKATPLPAPTVPNAEPGSPS